MTSGLPPLNALRAFEGVAKHGSFTAAANALLISQSALSRHVIALERLVGVQLFDRKPHALSLTKAGQHLLPAVVKSFDRLEYALDDIRNDGAPVQRTLRVQMPPRIMMVSDCRFQHSPMFGQEALSQTVCSPSSATRFLRSKKTSPRGIFIRIQSGLGGRRGAGSGATPPASGRPTIPVWLACPVCSACRIRSLRERVSTILSGMLDRQIYPIGGHPVAWGRGGDGPGVI